MTSPPASTGLPPGPLVVMCGHGERAMGAASLLERAGRSDVAVLLGGPEEWSAAAGTPLQTGSTAGTRPDRSPAAAQG